jgi:hypothetical protein
MMIARSGTGLDNVDCSVHAVASSSESRRMLMDVVNRLLPNDIIRWTLAYIGLEEGSGSVTTGALTGLIDFLAG